MAKINLLPWREQLREERKKSFLLSLSASVVVGLGLVFLADQYFNAAIDAQNARNDFLTQQIDVLDKRIKEIRDLKERRQVLLDRMNLIQDLQVNRPITARIFDQVTRTLPNGLYYTSIKLVGSSIDIKGAAESNNRVSELMRNLDGSDWLTAPNLNQVKATSAGEVEQSNIFELKVKQTRPVEVAKQGEES